MRTTGALVTASIALVALALVCAADPLLWHSDAWSLAVLLSALVLAVAVVLLVGFALTCVVPAWRRGANGRAEAFAVVCLTTALVVGVGDWVTSSAAGVGTFAAAVVLVAAAIGFLGSRLTSSDEVRGRVATAGMLVGVAAVAILTAQLVRAAASGAPAEAGQRQVVLVVIDDFPTQFLRTYNPDAAETAMDRLAELGQVFTAARTSKTWTNGFFGVLYSGRLSGHSDTSLIRTLQDQGVAVRWVAFHNNGVPESSNVSGYRGLRASMLTDRTAWLPHLLGLDYHLFLYGGRGTRGGMGAREAAVYEALNGRPRDDNPFTGALLTEAARLRSRASRSWLVFHLIHNFGQEERHWSMAEDGVFADFVRRATERDYAYGPEDEPLVRATGERTREALDRTGERLQPAVQSLLAADTPTTTIVTGDHGGIFEQGRIWYGFHPHDEVTRVPFFVFEAGAGGFEDRPLGTPDLLQAVIGRLGATRPATEGVGEAAGEERIVTSLTLRSDRRREWFLMLFTGRETYQVNLHPESDGSIQVTTAGSPATQPASDADGRLRRDVLAAIDAYGLDRAQLHTAFR